MQRDASSPVTLSEMIWSHPKIFAAYVERLVPNIKINNLSSDEFEVGNGEYDGNFTKLNDRKYIAEWIVSINISDDTSWDTYCKFLIENIKGTYRDPFDSGTRAYSETEVEDGEWYLWDDKANSRAVHAWKRAYKAMTSLLRSGELVARGRFQSALADLTEIPPHFWPGDAHSHAIDFENGRLRLITGEEFFFIQLFSSGESQEAFAKPSTIPKPSPKEALVLLALDGLGWRQRLPVHITAKARNNSIHKWLRDNKHPTVSDTLILQVISEYGLRY